MTEEGWVANMERAETGGRYRSAEQRDVTQAEDTVNALVDEMRLWAAGNASDSGGNEPASVSSELFLKLWKIPDTRSRTSPPRETPTLLVPSDMEQVLKTPGEVFSSGKIINIEDIAPIHLAPPDYKAPTSLPKVFDLVLLSPLNADVLKPSKESLYGDATCLNPNSKQIRDSDAMSGGPNALHPSQKQQGTSDDFKRSDQVHAACECDLASKTAELKSSHHVCQSNRACRLGSVGRHWQQASHDLCSDSTRELHNTGEFVESMMSDAVLSTCSVEVAIEMVQSLLNTAMPVVEPVQPSQKECELEDNSTIKESNEVGRAKKAYETSRRNLVDISGQDFAGDLKDLEQKWACCRKFPEERPHNGNLNDADILKTVLLILRGRMNNLCSQCFNKLDTTKKMLADNCNQTVIPSYRYNTQPKMSISENVGIYGERKEVNFDEDYLESSVMLHNKRQITNQDVFMKSEKLCTGYETASLGLALENTVTKSPTKFDDQYVYFAATEGKEEGNSVENASPKQSFVNIAKTSSGGAGLTEDKQPKSQRRSEACDLKSDKSNTEREQNLMSHKNTSREVIEDMNKLHSCRPSEIHLEENIQTSASLLVTHGNSGKVLSSDSAKSTRNTHTIEKIISEDKQHSRLENVDLNVTAHEVNASECENGTNNKMQPITEHLHPQNEPRLNRHSSESYLDFTRNIQLKNKRVESDKEIKNMPTPDTRDSAKVSSKRVIKKSKSHNKYWDRFIESTGQNESIKQLSSKRSNISKFGKLSPKHFEVVSLTKYNQHENLAIIPASKGSSIQKDDVEELVEETNFFPNLVLEPSKKQNKTASEANSAVEPGFAASNENTGESSKINTISTRGSIKQKRSKDNDLKQLKMDVYSENSNTSLVTTEKKQTIDNTTSVQSLGSDKTKSSTGRPSLLYKNKDTFQLDSDLSVGKGEEKHDSTKYSSYYSEGKNGTEVKIVGKRIISSLTRTSQDADLSNLSHSLSDDRNELAKQENNVSRNSSVGAKISSAGCSSANKYNSSTSLRRTSSRLDKSEYPSDSALAGVIHYRLSDPRFLEMGWSIIPSERTLAKVRTFCSCPAKPCSVWCAHLECRTYPGGGTMCAVDDQGCPNWYYPDGSLAASLSRSSTCGTLQVFALREEGSRSPRRVVAKFDSFGNGVVYGPPGDARLRFTQRGGVLWDTGGPTPMRWSWSRMKGVEDTLEEVVCSHEGPTDPHLKNPQALCGSKAYQAAIVRAKEEQAAALNVTSVQKKRSDTKRPRGSRMGTSVHRRSSVWLAEDSSTENNPSDGDLAADMTITKSLKHVWDAVLEAKEDDSQKCREEPAPICIYTPIKPILLKLNKYFVFRLVDQENVFLDFSADRHSRRLELGVCVDPTSVDHEDLLEPELLLEHRNSFFSVDALKELTS